jgi:hypothetical protein
MAQLALLVKLSALLGGFQVAYLLVAYLFLCLFI